jgi:tripartite-type tricarboxylate transporter receptor subunit TctC
MIRYPSPAAALAVLALCVVLNPASVRAQAFPSKPVRIVVPYTPGGGTDLVARTIAASMSKQLGQQVLVDNKPGAGTVIGSDAVAKSAPDGYTLLLTTSAHAINSSLIKTLPYSASKSFIGVSLIGRAPNVLLTRPDRPYRSIKDVISYAQANPGKLTYGSSGNGTAVHLAGELFKLMARSDITHVPYRGAGPALTDLLGGQIDFVFATIASAGPFIESGKLRALALTSAERSPSWPKLPTMAESGVTGYAAEVWYALFAPAGTPPEVVARLNVALKQAVQSEVFRKRVEAEGLVPDVGAPEQLDAFVHAEEARWAKVVLEGHITTD